MSFLGWAFLAGTHRRQLYLRKEYVFVVEKYIGDVRQDEKHALDLLESIIRPACLVKEDLRLILFGLTRFRPKTTRIRICTFQMSGKITDSSKTSP